MNRKVYTSAQQFHQQNDTLDNPLPFSQDVSVLSQPFALGRRTAPNRLVCQAMEGCDGTPGGSPGELTLRRYDRIAKGGSGVIWFEATAVLSEGRANPRQLYITPNNLDDFRRAVEEIKEAAVRSGFSEPVVIMQATHSGRYSKPQGVPAPLIAYSNPIFEAATPIDPSRIVSDDYLDRVGEALTEGALLAQKAGFDGVDIKSCHRYLLSELLSAYTRPGKYGGSLENRTSLLRQTVSAARQVTGGDFLVTSRLNVYDGFPQPWGFGTAPDGGTELDLSEPAWLLERLYQSGVSFLNITMGNPYFNPHVNRPFASGGYDAPEHPLQGVARMLHGTARLKQLMPRMQLICSGISYLGAAAPNVTAAFIQQGLMDAAGFGRTVLAYPDYARDIMQNGGMDPKKLCICCSKCTHIMRAPGGTPGCVIRDSEVYKPLYDQLCGGK